MNIWLALLVIGKLIVGQSDASQSNEKPPAAIEGSKIGTMCCPVMPDQEIDPAVFTEWHGRRVFFCCKRCKAKFEANPEQFADALKTCQPMADGVDRELRPRDPSRISEAGERRTIVEQRATGRGAAGEPRLIRWLGQFHPVTLHFPIGGMLAAMVAEFLFALRKNLQFEHAARFCLWFAMLSGILTGILGWFFGGVRLGDSDVLLAWHRWLGTATVLALTATVWAMERRRSRNGSRLDYRILMGFTTLLLSATGYFGGAMVWGIEHLAW